MSKWYVGVDVSKDELVAVVMGRKPKSFANTVTGSKALSRWAKTTASGATVHVCMEATGVYGYRAAMTLASCSKTEVSVVNPAQIAAFARAQLRRSKTDALDAQVILAFAQSQQPQPWHPQSAVMRQLYALVSQWDALAETKRRLNNRSHSHKHIPDLPPAVAKAQTSVIGCLQRQIARIQKAILELCQGTPELASQVALLSTIPGVKTKTAVHLLAYGKGTFTTHSRKELTAHAGLAPRQHQSGSSIRGKSYLAKQGDKRLRTALYMSAVGGTVNNPVLAPFYRRLLTNGKTKMAALTACMRKLLLIIQAMLKHHTPFNPELKPLT
jgi:transposase